MFSVTFFLKNYFLLKFRTKNLVGFVSGAEPGFRKRDYYTQNYNWTPMGVQTRKTHRVESNVS